MKLEELTPNAAVRGILSGPLVSVLVVEWFGSEALELTYEDRLKRVANALLIRVLESGEEAAADSAANLGSKAKTTREHPFGFCTLCERRKRAGDALSH